MANTIIYRLCNVNDLAQIRSLTNVVMANLEENGQSDFYDEVTEPIILSSMSNGSITIGAFSSDDGRMVGYLICKSANIEIAKHYAIHLSIPDKVLTDIVILKSITVLPSLQRTGIASQMLHYAFSWAKRNYVKRFVGMVHPSHEVMYHILTRYYTTYSNTFFYPDSKSNIKRKRFCVNIT